MPRTTNLSSPTPRDLAKMQAGPGTSPWIHRRSLSSPITSTSIPDRFDALGTKVPGSDPDTNELKSARDAHRLDCLPSDCVSRTRPRCDCAHRDQSTSGSAHYFMPTARAQPWEARPPRAGPHAARDTTKVGSHGRQTGSWLRRLP
jgi:hypothetical protein